MTGSDSVLDDLEVSLNGTSKSSIFPMGFSMTYPVHLPPAGDSSMTNRLKTVPFRPINLDDSIIPPWSWGNNLHYYYSNIDGHYNQKLYIKLLILQILCEKNGIQMM